MTDICSACNGVPPMDTQPLCLVCGGVGFTAPRLGDLLLALNEAGHINDRGLRAVHLHLDQMLESFGTAEPPNPVVAALNAAPPNTGGTSVIGGDTARNPDGTPYQGIPGGPATVDTGEGALGFLEPPDYGGAPSPAASKLLESQR